MEIFYPHLFKTFFKNETESEDETVFMFPYSIRKVLLNQSVSQEGVVTCPARVLKNYTIKQFFVSQAYQPHQSSDDGKMYFVFRDAENSLPDVLTLEALAEEPALATYTLARVEMIYLSKRWEFDAKRAFLKKLSAYA